MIICKICLYCNNFHLYDDVIDYENTLLKQCGVLCLIKTIAFHAVIDIRSIDVFHFVYICIQYPYTRIYKKNFNLYVKVKLNCYFIFQIKLPLHITNLINRECVKLYLYINK